MKIAFRVDASLQMGTGHVMRCLTLANGLKEQGVEVLFISRPLQGHLIERIKQEGVQCAALPEVRKEFVPTDSALPHATWLGVEQEQDAEECLPILQTFQPDWLIVDHYALDYKWENILKSHYKKLMVIDDLGDRKHLCDLLLDQNYGATLEKYKDLVPRNCQILAGSKYALLRPEFAKWREFSLRRRAPEPRLKTILVTLGGVDPDNYTGQVLEQLARSNLPPEIEIIVVMGATAPHLDAIQQQMKTMPYNTTVKTNVSNMAEIMANADLAIGAAGSTTWERCCLGLPSIQVVIAKNQEAIAASLEKKNAIKLIPSILDLKELIDSDQSWMKDVYHISSQICDGLGTDRVIEEVSLR